MSDVTRPPLWEALARRQRSLARTRSVKRRELLRRRRSSAGAVKLGSGGQSVALNFPSLARNEHSRGEGSECRARAVLTFLFTPSGRHLVAGRR